MKNVGHKQCLFHSLNPEMLELLAWNIKNVVACMCVRVFECIEDTFHDYIKDSSPQI